LSFYGNNVFGSNLYGVNLITQEQDKKQLMVDIPSIEIYNYRHERLAIITEAQNIILEVVYGGVWSLSFILPKKILDSDGNYIDNPNWDYIQNENLIKFQNHYYIIKNPKEIHDEQGKIVSNVQAEHMAIQLTYKRNQYLNLTPPENLPVTADVAITSILENAQTGWQLGTVSDSLLNNARTFKFEWQSTLYCLNEVAKKFGGFLYFDCYWDETNNKWIKTVSLLDEEVDNGVFFSYDKNLKLVEKEKDSSQLFTRLYCFGENTLSINSIPAEQITHYGVTYDLHPEGQSYIQNFQYFLAQGYTLQECLDNFVYEDRFKDEVYVDVQDLYDDCKKKLEEASMPKLTYYVKIVDLSYLTDYQHEKISIGEIITIKDKELGIDIKAKVMRMSINYNEPWNTQLEIANYQQDIEELLKNVIVQNSSMYYDRAVLRGQKLADTVKVDNNNGFTLVSKDTGEVLGVYGNFVYDGQSYTGVYVKNGAFIIDGGLTKDQLENSVQIQIDSLINDDKLTLVESKNLENSLNQLKAESTDLISTADSLGITTEKDNYQNALNDLETYLINNWINQPDYPLDITSIDRDTIKTKFEEVQNRKSILINKIAEERELNANAYTNQNAVIKGQSYNKVKITSENGIEVFDANNSERLKIADLGNDKYGIQIKKADGTVTFDVKSDGTVSIIDGSIDIIHSDGSQSILDANGLQVIFEKDEYNNPYSYTIYDANGQRRYLKGNRVATFFTVGSGDGWTNNDLKNLSYGDTINYYVYVFLDLIGEAWHELATIYNQVLNDSTKTKTERKNILTQILTTSCMATEDNGKPDNYNYLQTRTAEFLTKQIATSGIYVPEIIAVDVNDTVAKDSRSRPSYRTIDFRGAVMRAKGYAKYTHNGGRIWWTFYKDVRIIMQANGTLDVDC
jgi:phage minor structural protein